MKAWAAGVLVGAVVLGAGSGAQTVPDAVARHGACAAQAESSQTCVEILNAHCLEVARNARDLTGCRSAVTDALEVRADALVDQLDAQGARPMAIALTDGAARAVSEFCAALAGRMATPGAPQDIRCALMRAHVLVYHLTRALDDLDRET
ncbi:MAG: hypothetical protein AAF813_05805 [Pseudomonadota bacterium]